jgi:hypothetical protein
VGIWDFDSKDNPFADYSIVYMPYCDGSTFTGDNDVFDPAFGAAIGVPQAVVRFHRGLRNQSAGMDLARATFPNASRITVAGSSAGGVGAAGFAPFLARFVYGNQVHLTVFNDAGPVTVNLDAVDDVAARAADWQFGQFSWRQHRYHPLETRQRFHHQGGVLRDRRRSDEPVFHGPVVRSGGIP